MSDVIKGIDNQYTNYIARHVTGDSYHDLKNENIKKALYYNCNILDVTKDENNLVSKLTNYIFEDGKFSIHEDKVDDDDTKYDLFVIDLSGTFNNKNDADVGISNELLLIDLRKAFDEISGTIYFLIDFCSGRILRNLFITLPEKELCIMNSIFGLYDPAPKACIPMDLNKGDLVDHLKKNSCNSISSIKEIINDGTGLALASLRDTISNKKTYSYSPVDLFNCSTEPDKVKKGNEINEENLTTPLQLSGINFKITVGIVGSKAFVILTDKQGNKTIYDSKSSSKAGFNAFDNLTVDEFKTILDKFQTGEINGGVLDISTIKENRTDTTNAVAKYIGDTNQVLSVFLKPDKGEHSGTNGIITHDRLLVVKAIMTNVPVILYWNIASNKVSVFINKSSRNTEYMIKSVRNRIITNIMKHIIQKVVLKPYIETIKNEYNILLERSVTQITTIATDISNIQEEEISGIQGEELSGIQEEMYRYIFTNLNKKYEELTFLSYCYYELFLLIKTLNNNIFDKVFHYNIETKIMNSNIPVEDDGSDEDMVSTADEDDGSDEAIVSTKAVEDDGSDEDMVSTADEDDGSDEAMVSTAVEDDGSDEAMISTKAVEDMVSTADEVMVSPKAVGGMLNVISDLSGAVTKIKEFTNHLKKDFNTNDVMGVDGVATNDIIPDLDSLFKGVIDVSIKNEISETVIKSGVFADFSGILRVIINENDIVKLSSIEKKIGEHIPTINDTDIYLNIYKLSKKFLGIDDRLFNSRNKSITSNKYKKDNTLPLNFKLRPRKITSFSHDSYKKTNIVYLFEMLSLIKSNIRSDQDEDILINSFFTSFKEGLRNLFNMINNNEIKRFNNNVELADIMYDYINPQLDDILIQVQRGGNPEKLSKIFIFKREIRKIREIRDDNINIIHKKIFVKNVCGLIFLIFRVKNKYILGALIQKLFAEIIDTPGFRAMINGFRAMINSFMTNTIVTSQYELIETTPLFYTDDTNSEAATMSYIHTPTAIKKTSRLKRESYETRERRARERRYAIHTDPDIASRKRVKRFPPTSSTSPLTPTISGMSLERYNKSVSEFHIHQNISEIEMGSTYEFVINLLEHLSSIDDATTDIEGSSIVNECFKTFIDNSFDKDEDNNYEKIIIEYINNIFNTAYMFSRDIDDNTRDILNLHPYIYNSINDTKFIDSILMNNLILKKRIERYNTDLTDYARATTVKRKRGGGKKSNTRKNKNSRNSKITRKNKNSKKQKVNHKTRRVNKPSIKKRIKTRRNYDK